MAYFLITLTTLIIAALLTPIRGINKKSANATVTYAIRDPKDIAVNVSVLNEAGLRHSSIQRSPVNDDRIISGPNLIRPDDRLFRRFPMDNIHSRSMQAWHKHYGCKICSVELNGVMSTSSTLEQNTSSWKLPLAGVNTNHSRTRLAGQYNSGLMIHLVQVFSSRSNSSTAAPGNESRIYLGPAASHFSGSCLNSSSKPSPVQAEINPSTSNADANGDNDLGLIWSGDNDSGLIWSESGDSRSLPKRMWRRKTRPNPMNVDNPAFRSSSERSRRTLEARMERLNTHLQKGVVLRGSTGNVQQSNRTGRRGPNVQSGKKVQRKRIRRKWFLGTINPNFTRQAPTHPSNILEEKAADMIYPSFMRQPPAPLSNIQQTTTTARNVFVKSKSSRATTGVLFFQSLVKYICLVNACFWFSEVLLVG